jgi:ABC-type Fe3+ transport system permease subunit
LLYVAGLYRSSHQLYAGELLVVILISVVAPTLLIRHWLRLRGRDAEVEAEALSRELEIWSLLTIAIVAVEVVLATFYALFIGYLIYSGGFAKPL